MLYGAPRQSGLLVADLRSGARQAADRDRARRGADLAGIECRPTAPTGTHHSLLAIVLRHVRQAPAAHAPAR
jgi:hypothetical protein